MRSSWIHVAILGIACMMLGVNGNNTTSSSNSTGSWISSNMTTNLTQTHPPSMTTNLNQTHPPSMTSNLTRTLPPSMTSNLTRTHPPSVTTNLNQTHPPSVTSNLNQTHPPSMTSNLTRTHPPSVTTNLNQTHPPSVTSNLNQTHPPSMTSNLTQMLPPSVTSNLTQTHPPSVTTNPTQMGPLNVTTNKTQMGPFNMTTNPTQMGPFNMSINPTQMGPLNITTNPNHMGLFNMTSNPTQMGPFNMTAKPTQMGPLNMTSNLTQTRAPNITTNLTQTGPLNTTANLTQTRPPNMTINVTQMGPLNMTTNQTQTRPPNMSTNLTLTPSGSNTFTSSNVNNLSLEIPGRDNCRRDRACFSAPPTCNPGAQGSCYFFSTKGVSGSADNLTFELSGESDGYIGAGLSRDKSGQGATVYSCANVNGTPTFSRSTLNNQRLTQDITFIPGSFRGLVKGRKIQCIFTAAGLSSTARAANTDTFVFFLTGGVSNGSLDSPVTRLSTNVSVDLSNPNSTDVSVITPTTDATTTAPYTTASNVTAASFTTASSNITASNVTAASFTTASTASGVSTANNGTANDKVTKDNCKKDRACFSTPASCDPSSSSSCIFASTRGVNGNSDNLTFELSGDANGYIAVGLSRDKKEGDDDTVYSCANDNGVAKFIRASLNNTILTPDKTFNPGSFRGSVSGTKIQCIFVAAGLSSITRAANTNTFLYFFTGNYTNGTLGSPVTQLSTNSSTDLTNTNSSDVVIITPTTNTDSNTTTTTVSTTTTTMMTTAAAKPTTTAGSNALHHAASRAALVILSGILAVLLL